MGKPASQLVDAYITALPLAAISITESVDLRRSRIEPGRADKARHRLWIKASHLELLFLPDDWTDQRADELLRLVEDTALQMGARIWREAELRQVAAAEVELISAKIDRLRADGELKDFNRRFKLYRQAQVATGEKAVGYSAYLADLTKTMVEEVARAGRAVA